MDAAFFQREILRLLAARGCAYAIKVGYWRWLPLKPLAAERRDVTPPAGGGCSYAIKVGYWSWLPLKQLAAERRDWTPLAPGVTGFEHRLTIPQWDVAVRMMIYRKHVRHASRKNFQLDLFTPDDGHFEYYAVATNMALPLPALFAFVG